MIPVVLLVILLACVQSAGSYTIQKRSTGVTITECQKDVTLTAGMVVELLTPSYPALYPAVVDCEWNFVLPAPNTTRTRIAIAIDNGEVTCKPNTFCYGDNCSDYLYYDDGRDRRKFCGLLPNFRTWRTKNGTSTLKVMFYASPEDGERRGFLAHITGVYLPEEDK